jgi:flavin reductase (DIM6/NTAB) family NADH-FMN oxidoreductase RutF
MEDAVRKTALRMIPYGLYVLASEASDGRVAAATVNWVTQASFEPPLVAVGVKVDSASHGIIQESGAFSLSVLGKAQGAEAFAFFKPVEREGDSIGGHTFGAGEITGSPMLLSSPAAIECELLSVVSEGDHSLFVGKVVNAVVREEPEGRADDATLWLKDLGEKIFYGG